MILVKKFQRGRFSLALFGDKENRPLWHHFSVPVARKASSFWKQWRLIIS